MRKKRQIASWILLAVFVPMMVLSSFHTHHAYGSGHDDCEACVNHHCYGHLAQQTADMHQCVLCQFLTLPMAVATTLTLSAVMLFAKHKVVCCYAADIVYRRERSHGLRASPVVC